MKYRLFIILFFILGISCQQNKTFRSIDSFRNRTRPFAVLILFGILTFGHLQNSFNPKIPQK